MTTICLNMIVKNEARVIARCLESVKPWIHSWVIVDTGSTDGTQDRVRETLKDLPGELVQRPWRNFGSNRSEAIQLAGTRADYLLFLDADEEWLAPEGFRWPRLEADAYRVMRRYGDMAYARDALAATRLPWRFEGVLHEYLHCPEPHRRETLDGPAILVRPEGARSSNPNKFLDDAALLRRALEREPGNPRYTFYLAQSWRDAGVPEASLECYEQRIPMGGWAEEVWYSMYQSALLRERLGRGRAEVLDAYLRAYQYRPSRPETLGQLARWCRLRGECELARMFAAQAMAIPPTEDILFVETAFAAWRNRDEYAVACYWSGRRDETARVCRELLQDGSLPEGERARVEANLGFALDQN